MCNSMGYTLMAIRSFRHKGLEEFFITGSKRGIQPTHARKLEDILDRLDGAAIVGAMDFPGSFLHPLKGLKGIGLSESRQLAHTFRFEDGDAHIVDYTDYH